MTSDQAPCGLSPQSSQRTSIPLNGFIIATKIFHKGANLTYRMSLLESPLKQEDFTSEISPAFTVVKASTVRSPPISFEAFALKEGQVATLQVFSEDSHSKGYQCMDVAFGPAQAKSSGFINFTSMGAALLSVILSLQL
jgi:hypothetical protein